LRHRVLHIFWRDRDSETMLPLTPKIAPRQQRRAGARANPSWIESRICSRFFVLRISDRITASHLSGNALCHRNANRQTPAPLAMQLVCSTLAPVASARRAKSSLHTSTADGGEWEFVADAAGEFEYACTPHLQMTGSITVEAH